MIAAAYNVCARPEQRVRKVGRYSGYKRSVFTVNNAEINFIILPYLPKVSLQMLNPLRAYDVADNKYVHKTSLFFINYIQQKGRCRSMPFFLAAFSALCLFCVIDNSVFANYADLDLSGIIKLVLDFLRDIARKNLHLVVINDFGLDHYANLASRLDCKGFLNSVKSTCNLFKLLKTLNVIFNVLSARSGTRCADSVSRLNNKRKSRFGLNVVMMRLECVNNVFILTVLRRDFNIFPGWRRSRRPPASASERYLLHS